MSKFFNIGFIGAGGIARTHMRHLQKVDGVKVVAAADISEPSLNRVREEYGVEKIYDDYTRMLREEPELHAVSVCTPNGLHAENAIAALEAGKHVLVEKPMAMNATEGQKMLDAAKAAKKHLVVGFQYRFSPKTRVIRRQVESGNFGKILYVRCQALRRRGIPNWGVFGRKDLQGGGPMIDIGVHMMELAHYMIGSPRPVAASGQTFTYLGDKPSDVISRWQGWDHENYTVEDLAVGMVRFDNGAILNIEASFVAHIPKGVLNVQIMGERGGAVWDPPEIFRDQDGYMMNLAPDYIGEWNPFEEKMRHFVQVCRDGRTNESSGEQGLMIQKMLDGIYASAEAGREVRIE